MRSGGHFDVMLKFTPLEFETISREAKGIRKFKLKFTPLEFETSMRY